MLSKMTLRPCSPRALSPVESLQGFCISTIALGFVNYLPRLQAEEIESASSDFMAPKGNRPKVKPTTFLEKSLVIDDVLTSMVKGHLISKVSARAPSKCQTTAKPKKDEIIVFKDFFVTDLRF